MHDRSAATYRLHYWAGRHAIQLYCGTHPPESDSSPSLLVGLSAIGEGLKARYDALRQSRSAASECACQTGGRASATKGRNRRSSQTSVHRCSGRLLTTASERPDCARHGVSKILHRATRQIVRLD
jgi:hypothetical protein